MLTADKRAVDRCEHSLSIEKCHEKARTQIFKNGGGRFSTDPAGPGDARWLLEGWLHLMSTQFLSLEPVPQGAWVREGGRLLLQELMMTC